MRQAMVWYSSQPLASASSAGSGVCTCTAPSVRCQCSCTAASACAAAAPPRKRCDQLAGFVEAAPHAEPEHDLARLAVLQVDRHLDRGAGVECGAVTAGQARAPQRRRLRHGTVAADELGAVAGEAALDSKCVIDVEEADPVAVVVAVRVACVQRAAFERHVGEHMRRRLGAHVAEHPFDIAGHAQAARPPRAVAQTQHGELHCRIERDEDPQLGVDAVGLVFEEAVSKAMAGGERVVTRAGQRGRRPELAALLVAQVDGLAAAVADRVVVPGREAQLVGVLAPGVGAAGFRDHAAEARVGKHVGPRRRRLLAGRRGDDVLARVGSRRRPGRWQGRRDGRASSRAPGRGIATCRHGASWPRRAA